MIIIKCIFGFCMLFCLIEWIKHLFQSSNGSLMIHKSYMMNKDKVFRHHSVSKSRKTGSDKPFEHVYM
jgi:hypothetical protein